MTGAKKPIAYFVTIGVSRMTILQRKSLHFEKSVIT